jgi:hypothetical protein
MITTQTSHPCIASTTVNESNITTFNKTRFVQEGIVHILTTETMVWEQVMLMVTI